MLVMAAFDSSEHRVYPTSYHCNEYIENYVRKLVESGCVLACCVNKPNYPIACVFLHISVFALITLVCSYFVVSLQNAIEIQLFAMS